MIGAHFRLWARAGIGCWHTRWTVSVCRLRWGCAPSLGCGRFRCDGIRRSSIDSSDTIAAAVRARGVVGAATSANIVCIVATTIATAVVAAVVAIAIFGIIISSVPVVVVLVVLVILFVPIAVTIARCYANRSVYVIGWIRRRARAIGSVRSGTIADTATIGDAAEPEAPTGRPARARRPARNDGTLRLRRRHAARQHGAGDGRVGTVLRNAIQLRPGAPAHERAVPCRRRRGGNRPVPRSACASRTHPGRRRRGPGGCAGAPAAAAGAARRGPSRRRRPCMRGRCRSAARVCSARTPARHMKMRA